MPAKGQIKKMAKAKNPTGMQAKITSYRHLYGLTYRIAAFSISPLFVLFYPNK